MKFSLSSYTIRIEHKPDKKQNNGSQALPYLLLDNFVDGADLFDVFKEYLESLKSAPLFDQDQKTSLRVSTLNVQNRIISGVIESGPCGITSKLIDIETNHLKYQRRLTDAEIMPFYFLISIPKHKNEGILFLERISNYGIRKILGNCFGKHFSKKYSSFYVVLNPLVLDRVVQQILYDGIIKKLRFVKYEIPTDRFDGVDEGHQEIFGNVELIISANRIPVLNRIKQLFNGNLTVKNLFELRDVNFEYDTIKVEVDINGSRRVINLGDWQKVRNYIDISNRIKLDSDGHPNFDSIEHEALELYKYLSSLLYKN